MNLLTPNVAKPYQNEGLNTIYDMLFCDTIAVYQQSTKAPDYPWDTLLTDSSNLTQLQIIATDQSLEARQRLLACHLLSVSGFLPTHSELTGVIIEVALPEGLDVLAAYADGTARYINHTEQLLVWDTRTDESDQFIDQLFAHSRQVVSQIGRWDGARQPFPANGMIRLNFLTSDGLYFGEGPFNALYADPMGAPVIDSGIQLMDYLTQMATKSHS